MYHLQHFIGHFKKNTIAQKLAQVINIYGCKLFSAKEKNGIYVDEGNGQNNI